MKSHGLAYGRLIMASELSFSGWKRDLCQTWIELGVPEFLDALGVNFEREFVGALMSSSSETDPYSDCIWAILPNSAIPAGVLHCYPKLVDEKKVSWEEWFLLDGNIRHHYLSNHTFDGEEGVWTPELGDKDHPREVLSSSWHFMNSLDHRPTRLC